jgi:spore coat protein A
MHPRRTYRVLLALALAVLFAFAGNAQTRLDPINQPKFVNPLPNPLDNVLVPDTTTYPGYQYYKVSMTQFQQALGIVDPLTLAPLVTTVWGYNGTYPGPTFEATTGQPVKARFANNLVDSLGNPLPHLLPLDTTVHCGNDQFGNPTFCRPFVRTVAHLHGGHVPDHSDGNPEAWFSAGWAEKGLRWSRKIYDYPNDQEAATLWYHDHALGTTRLNVYAGLAGFYLLRDSLERSLQNQHYLPKYPYEIPMVIQDRAFYIDGSLAYPKDPWLDAYGNPASLDPLTGQPVPSIQPEFFGDFVLVNGMTWPVLDVEPRVYRFRILNGSGARFYDLRLSIVSGTTTKPPMYQIGSDGGFLDAPVALSHLILAPGERADVLVDFSQSQGMILNFTNTANAPYPYGDPPVPDTTGKILQMRVINPLGTRPDTVIPTTLRTVPIPDLVATPGVPDREVVLAETTDGIDRVLPLLGTNQLGRLMWDDPVTETPKLGTTERWTIINDTVDTHPVHLHLVQFQVINRESFDMIAYRPGHPLTLHLSGIREAPAQNEKGWKDTVRAPTGMVTRVIAKFDLAGLYVWHCHILEHEDNEMMRPLQVIP